ncbi:MAG: class C sortase [Cellulomonadaceae bacterium]|jgi:sortase A|nr:class C sortase [Cellulomonadaceae bacterium]
MRRLVIWVLLITLGVALPVLPHALDWFNTRVHAGTMSASSQAISHLSDDETAGILAAAEQYNRDLVHAITGRSSELSEEYLDQLNVPGTDVMAKVAVPSVGITIPIFHGTADDTLYRGAGHQYGTSLPVGGTNTHAVITAHSGLARHRLFTDLHDVVKGDLFSITAAGRVLWYEVDQILVVEPGDIEELRVQGGKDLVTLFTCTPTGVNSHRLLVRGHRTEAPGDMDGSFFTQVDAGFPWWAAVVTSAAMASTFTGKRLFIPARPASAGEAGISGSETGDESALEALTPPHVSHLQLDDEVRR